MATCTIDFVTLPCLQNEMDDMSISLLSGIHQNDDDYEIIDKDGVSTMIAARDISKGAEVAYIYGQILLLEDGKKITKKFPKRDWDYILMHGVCASSIIAVDVTDVEDSPCKFFLLATLHGMPQNEAFAYILFFSHQCNTALFHKMHKAVRHSTHYWLKCVTR